MVDKVKNSIVRMARLMYGVVFLALAFVVVRVIILKCDDEDYWTKIAASIDDVPEEGRRGDIISSDGRILASSVPTYELRWDFRGESLYKNDLFERNVDSLSVCMSQLFNDSSAQAYAKGFRDAFKAKKIYFLVKKKITHQQMLMVRTFPIFKLGRYKSGLIIEEKRTRENPHHELARRCIGYLNDQGAQVGLEKAYNDKLSGVKGKLRKYKIAGGEMYPMSSYVGNIEPQDGCDIVTTLDVSIQDVAEKSLLASLENCNAEMGTAVVMEVSTGKIRAMANLKYDEKSGKYTESFNVAIGKTMPPGSTFKLATMIAVLEKTGMEIDDMVKLPGKYYRFSGDAKPIEDEDPHVMTGDHSIREIFELSSNVGVATLARKAYPKASDEHEFTERLAKMHLDKLTGVEIEGEMPPVFMQAGASRWWAGSLEKMAIGYETEYTPLQTLAFYNAVANDGRLVRPRLLEAVKKHGVVIEEGETEELKSSICDKATLNKVRELLVGVVERGTASRINNKYFQIAGKTGTAQVFENNKMVGYSASFAGFFPADHPKYSCIVVIYKPKKNFYESGAAAPVFKDIAEMLCAKDRDLHTKKNFDIASYGDKHQLPKVKSGDREIMDRLFSEYHINVDNVENSQKSHYVSTSNGNNVVTLEPIPVQKAQVPNVIGMGLREAMYLLRQQKLKVTVVGRGAVKKQSLQAYTKVKSGDRITIELGIN